jgi:plasmid stability protein
MVTDQIGERRVKRRPRDRSTRIYYAADRPPSFVAMWTSRLAIFCAGAALVTAVLHRLMVLPTPVAMTMAEAIFAGGALSLLMGVIAGLDIWVTGRQGAARVFCGSLVALVILAVPAVVWATSFNWPAIYDVSTDLAEPPEFTDAKESRSADANSVDYPGDAFAALQRTHYPDLKSLVMPRSTDEAFELVLQALAKLKLKTSLELPPEDEQDEPGFIELSEHSQVLGLVDDIVIRVLGEDLSARIDVRSASRYGTNDFGRNAEHVREILKEVAARYEASVPDADAAQKDKAKAKLKGPKGRDQASKADRRRPNPARSDIRHGLERKGLRPGSTGSRGPGRPQGQFDE